jgi:tetratricopeptide (TPR) repeat protein
MTNAKAAFAAGEYKSAAQDFRMLAESARDPGIRLSWRLWQASSYTHLQQFEKALEILVDAQAESMGKLVASDPRLVRARSEELIARRQVAPNPELLPELLEHARFIGKSLGEQHPEVQWVHREILSFALDSGALLTALDSARILYEVSAETGQVCDLSRSQVRHTLGLTVERCVLAHEPVADSLRILGQLRDDSVLESGPDAHEQFVLRERLAYVREQIVDFDPGSDAVRSNLAERLQLAADAARSLDETDRLRVSIDVNLAAAQSRWADEEQARTSFAEILTRLSKLWGPEDVDALKVRRWLAYFDAVDGEWAQAGAELVAIRRAQARLLGEDHRDVELTDRMMSEIADISQGL